MTSVINSLALLFSTLDVKEFRYRPGEVLKVPKGLGIQILGQSAHEGGKVVSLTSSRLVIISVRG
jgi:hypothetical protein